MSLVVLRWLPALIDYRQINPLASIIRAGAKKLLCDKVDYALVVAEVNDTPLNAERHRRHSLGYFVTHALIQSWSRVPIGRRHFIKGSATKSISAIAVKTRNTLKSTASLYRLNKIVSSPRQFPAMADTHVDSFI